MFKLINTHQEYMQLTKEVYKSDYFDGDVSRWHEYFETLESYHEDYSELEEWTDPSEYNGSMKNCPQQSEFPVVLYYTLESSWDRMGDFEINIWDWKSMEEL